MSANLSFVRAMTDPYHLQRFVDAQASCFAQVRSELAAGKKRSHWMWFVFPQLSGLGSSPMAQRFAISGIDEAKSLSRSPHPWRPSPRLYSPGERCGRPIHRRHLRLPRRPEVSLLRHPLCTGSRAPSRQQGFPRGTRQILRRSTRQSHHRSVVTFKCKRKPGDRNLYQQPRLGDRFLSQPSWVPHISLVFREMWDTTNLDVLVCGVENLQVQHRAPGLGC